MDDGSTRGASNSSMTSQPWLPVTAARPSPEEKLRVAKGELESNPIEQACRKSTVHWEEGSELETSKSRLGSNSLYASAAPRKNEGVVGREKKLKMELPPLPSLAEVRLFTSALRSTGSENGSDSEQFSVPTSAHPKLHHSHSWPPSSPIGEHPFINPFAANLPLTPPQEDTTFHWLPSDSESFVPPRSHSLSSDRDSSIPELNTTEQQSSSSRPTTISLPGFQTMSDQNASPSTWLERAVNTIVSCHSDDSNNRGQLQMVVQALPSQTKTPAGKPAFQEVAEALQQRATQVPYITITHAVSQVVSMEEVPASPPATPNNQQETDDYFDNQTIFTHAAVVPNYHGPLQPLVSVSTRPTGIIAAPSSIQVSTLERYIPPTTAQEVDDFFSISRRSYLVDRMTELSATNGTLLVVYPTQVGGTVFARQYIGPVLDPFLRRFVLLNNLTTDAAAALGKHSALPRMRTFEEMNAGLKNLCETLTQRAPRRGLRGEYRLIHSEKAEITLDRVTWLGWFIEQESSRLRQNMIEYQKAGGRMPTRGFDASPGSLAREVVEGIKNSKEEAGGVGIEVGVFVVRRSVQ